MTDVSFWSLHLTAKVIHSVECEVGSEFLHLGILPDPRSAHGRGREGITINHQGPTLPSRRREGGGADGPTAYGQGARFHRGLEILCTGLQADLLTSGVEKDSL